MTNPVTTKEHTMMTVIDQRLRLLRRENRELRRVLGRIRGLSAAALLPAQLGDLNTAAAVEELYR